MENQKTETVTEKPKKTKAPKPVVTVTPILGLNRTETPNVVEKIYQAYVATTQANKTKAAALVQKAAASEVGKLAKAQEEPRKELKTNTARAKQIAEENFVKAKRAAKGAYDSAMHKIQAEHDRTISDLSTTFNNAVTPINERTKTELEAIEFGTAETITAATAEYQTEIAASRQRETERVAKAEADQEAAVKAAHIDAAADAATKQVEETKPA